MYHSSKSTLTTPIPNSHFRALRIRKSNLVKFTTQEELQDALFRFCRKMKIHLCDFGFHNGGNYMQCHIHALVQTGIYFCKYGYLQDGVFNCYWEPLKNRKFYAGYMHKEDKNTQAKRDNLKAENYYRHHYLHH